MTKNYPIQNDEILQIAKELLTTQEKPFCYKEYIDRNIEFIKSEFFEDLDEIDELNFFNSRFSNGLIVKYILKKYITDADITDEKRSDIYDGISKTLDIRYKIHTADLLKTLNRQELEANSYSELISLRENLLKEHLNSLIKCRHVLGKGNTSYFEALISLEKIYPHEIAEKFMACEIKEGMTYSRFLREYPIMIASMGKIEQANNKNLKEVVVELTDRILYMNSSNFSLRQIQKILTEECIENGIIPATVTRMSREKGSKDKVVSAPTLLPISAIKKVIAENTQLTLT